MAFQIFTDSSTDLSKELREQHNIQYFRMEIVIKGEVKPADMDWEVYSPEELYGWIKDLNNHCKTSLITYGEYLKRCEEYLEKGIDILYIACTTALSGSLNTFRLVKEELQEKYPERKIIGIDGKRANMSLGLIVLHAAELQEQGKSIEEVEQWVYDNQQYFHEVGSLETLTYLKAAGRVSGAAAFFGNLISLKPIIMFDVHGHNYVFKKVRGSKAALEASFEYIKENINERTKVCYVGQAMAKDAQAYFKKRIEEELNIPVKEFWIGPIVGISCGPGMYGVFFEGKEVTVDSENLKK
jgi:DegV family protein with EDD domain